MDLITPTSVFEFDHSSAVDFFRSLDQPAYRADQLWKGIYQHYWHSPDDFSTFPVKLREILDQILLFSSLAEEKTIHSTDGQTEKKLYRLVDDLAIETVLMRYQGRNTACISSQVGCGMGCEFCATGSMGFVRNLTKGEIVEQVVRVAKQLAGENQELTNVVFMGMGEPFHNFDAVMAAIGILNDPKGMNYGARRFTISTVGLVPEIYQFTEENSQVNLAVSLHAAEDTLRSSLMAINRRYPLAELMTACKHYTKTTRRRITFEWALIAGVNDSVDQAKKLVDLIGGMLAHVNIIPLNPIAQYAGEPAADQQVQLFQQVLTKAHISCTIRLRRGIDIQAGCGQLASEAEAR